MDRNEQTAGRGAMRASQPKPALVIRPIEPGDKAILAEGFAHWSTTSRYRRFLEPHARLSSSELRYLTEVDHHDHEGLVALDPDTGAGVGVARYIRSRLDPSTAEVAVSVAEERQGQGVGTELAQALAARARADGIDTFTALCLAENRAILELLRSLGATSILSRERGVVELNVDLRGGKDGVRDAG